MSDCPSPPLAISIGIFALLLLGCSEASDGTSSGAWTIQEGALTLTETLRAGDDEDYFFGEIADVAVRADGRIYVADEESSHVKVLGPDGALQDSVGRKGEGPGEFQRLSQVVLARGDSMYVLDTRRSQVSVFAPDGEFAYSFLARHKGGGVSKVMVPPNVSGFVYADAPGARAVLENDASYVVLPGWSNGEFGDTLFTAPPYEVASREEGGTTIFMFLPFARSSVFAMGPNGRIHSGWQDSLRIVVHDQEGGMQRAVEIPFKLVPVSEEERKEALSGRSGESLTILKREIANTKPAFEHFLVDDEGRYWFGRPTTNPDSTDWWVAWPDEQRVVTTTLPSEVQLEVVKNGHAYGQTTTENGAPALIRYQIDREN